MNEETNGVDLGSTETTTEIDATGAPTTAAERIALLQKQIDEEREGAIVETHAKIAEHEKALEGLRADLVKLGAEEPAPARRVRAKKTAAAPKTPKVADDRPLATRIKGVLRHSKEAMRSEQIATQLGEDSRVVSAELRKLRSAEEVTSSGEKRSTVYELARS